MFKASNQRAFQVILLPYLLRFLVNDENRWENDLEIPFIVLFVRLSSEEKKERELNVKDKKAQIALVQK